MLAKGVAIMSVSDPLELYANLRELAHARLRKNRGTPLQTTDLIHDTYIRLRKYESNWEKAHFSSSIYGDATLSSISPVEQARRTSATGDSVVRIVRETEAADVC